LATETGSPALVEGLEGVRGIALAAYYSLAVTRSGLVFQWGRALVPGAEESLRSIIVEGFGDLRVRCVCAGGGAAFAIGEDGELFSWGSGQIGVLGHGDTQDQPSPKRVEALRGIRVSRVSVGIFHALALAEDGLVYAWGENLKRALLGNPDVERELLPTPVEALRGVRMGSVAASRQNSYAVADTGELWVWGVEGDKMAFPGHGEHTTCPLPTPIKPLRGIKVDAVAASTFHTLALADDGSVYAWGSSSGAASGAPGLGYSVSVWGWRVPTPQRVPALRVTCGL
jgi:alpha-tubulin suppressor-like RCC1 family protein